MRGLDTPTNAVGGCWGNEDVKVINYPTGSDPVLVSELVVLLVLWLNHIILEKGG